MKTSFNLSFSAQRTKQRYGAGITTTSVLSKFVPYPSSMLRLPSNGFGRSNDYSRNDCTSNWKAILLNKVVVGKVYKMADDDPTMTGPPVGYDSVGVVAL